MSEKKTKKVKPKKNIDHNSLAELLWEYKIEEKALVDAESNLKKQIKHFESLESGNHDAVLESLKSELSKIINTIVLLKAKINKLKENIVMSKVNQDMRKMISTLESQIAKYRSMNLIK